MMNEEDQKALPQMTCLKIRHKLFIVVFTCSLTYGEQVNEVPKYLLLHK